MGTSNGSVNSMHDSYPPLGVGLATLNGLLVLAILAVFIARLMVGRTPLVVIDFLPQGSYVDADGDLITGSTMWPNATEAAEDLGLEAQFAEAVELSKRVVSVMVSDLDKYGHATITRYPGTTTPGIARNAYGLLGAGSVLFEMRGGIGQKSNGYITKTAYNAALSIVEALADGSLFTADTAVADALPDRGPGISAPNDEEHAG